MVPAKVVIPPAGACAVPFVASFRAADRFICAQPRGSRRCAGLLIPADATALIQLVLETNACLPLSSSCRMLALS